MIHDSTEQNISFDNNENHDDDYDLDNSFIIYNFYYGNEKRKSF
jgi:hypothetical protein